MDLIAEYDLFNTIFLETVWTSRFIVNLIVMAVLLVLSALFSGSEVAYFSISTQQKNTLREEGDSRGERILTLLEYPNKEIASKRLLATILIANNFVNVAIVLISTFIAEALIPESLSAFWKAFIQVGVITFVLVLIGEVVPKVYATRNNLQLAKFMAAPLSLLKRIFGFMSNFLISSTAFIDKRFSKDMEGGISSDELEHAVELTKDQEISNEEQKIFEGIVNFGNIDVKQAMTSRIDVTAIEVSTPYAEVLQVILDSKFSRIPVYEESMDQIVGILYVKDLLAHIHETNFEWKGLVRSAYFVPEMKKLDDLLREFQEMKNHLAIVVDEYGGTSGIISMEDILEEIVGEITDEFDTEDLNYSKLDEKTYLIEGKTALIDMYRLLDIDGAEFEGSKGEADTVAGFIIEISGKIPLKGEKINFEHYTFIVDAADKRKVKRVKIVIGEKVDEE